MEWNLDDFIAKNNENSDRFEAQIQGQTAVLTYRRVGKSIVFDHTEVPAAPAGRRRTLKVGAHSTGICALRRFRSGVNLSLMCRRI